jgi:hypothetical protein
MPQVLSVFVPTLIGLPILLVVLLLAFGAFVFWLWMLVDCLGGNKPTTEKLLWFILIFFFPFLGSLIYFLVGRSSSARMR